jgi:two-component system alkaline phosphatase synthesis response regulator PhoP
MNESILLIEDEESMRVFLGDRLRSEGYSVENGKDGVEGLEKATSTPFDLIVLDLMLPGMNGLDVCRRIRLAGMATPILILTARGQLQDKISGLKIGADDYVTKPFEIREVLARIEALLRRAVPSDLRPANFEFGPLKLDLSGTQVYLHGAPVTLSAREFQLLRYLVLHRGKTLTREELLRQVWGYSADAYTRTVDVHIASLRTKLATHPEGPTFIQTVKGLGYKFVA